MREHTDRRTQILNHIFGFDFCLVTLPTIYCLNIFNVQNEHFYNFILCIDKVGILCFLL